MQMRKGRTANRTFTGNDAAAATGITQLGIQNPSTIFRNLSYPELAEHEERKKVRRSSHTQARTHHSPTPASPLPRGAQTF